MAKGMWWAGYRPPAPPPAEPTSTFTPPRVFYAAPTREWQELCNAIWREWVTAAEAYFVRRETAWAGDPGAPEWPDAIVEAYAKHVNGYQQDSGAITLASTSKAWPGRVGEPYDNQKKDRLFDFGALPPAWKRAICERVWRLCINAGLQHNEGWCAGARQKRIDEGLETVDREGGC